MTNNLINCLSLDQTVLNPLNGEISPASATTFSSFSPTKASFSSFSSTNASSLSSIFFASAVRKRTRMTPTQAAPKKRRATSAQVSNLAICQVVTTTEYSSAILLWLLDLGHIGARHALAHICLYRRH